MRWCKNCAKCFIIPQRYVISLVAMLALGAQYASRIGLHKTITEMVEPEPVPKYNDTIRCDSQLTKRVLMEETDKIGSFPWTADARRELKFYFFVFYSVMHIPAGILADWYGAKYVALVSIIGSSAWALAMPILLTSTNGSLLLVKLMKVVQGTVQAFMYPALSALIVRWSPIHERATLCGIVFSGTRIGVTLGTVVKICIADKMMLWELNFYIFGILNATAALFWMIFVYSKPDLHPCIKDKEKALINQELSNCIIDGKKKIPWYFLYKCAPLRTLFLLQFIHDYGFSLLVTSLTKYMDEVLRFSIEKNDAGNTVPHIIAIVLAIFVAWISDYFTRKNPAKVQVARKSLGVIACMGPGIFIIAGSISGCNSDLAVVFFSIAMILSSIYYVSIKVAILDLAPNYAGLLLALSNGFGSLGGLAARYIVGVITADDSIVQWRAVFWIAFDMYTLATVVFIVWGSSEQQWWNDPRKVEEVKIEKLKAAKEHQEASGSANL